MKAIKLVLLTLLSLIISLAQAQLNFQSDSVIWVNANIDFLKISDLDNDGVNEIITTTYLGNYREHRMIRIYSQDSLGNLSYSDSITFANHHTGGHSNKPETIDVADLNNDSLKDILIGYKNYIRVYYQDSTHTFNKYHYHQIQLPNNILDAEAGDLNNDGLNDIAVVLWYTDSIHVHYQTNNGFFDSAYFAPKTYKTELELFDVNNDSLLDLVFIANSTANNLHPYIQNTNGILIKDSVIKPFDSDNNNRVNSFEGADVNQDGYIDICIVSSSFVDNNYFTYNLLYNPNTTNHDSIQYIEQAQSANAVKVFDLNCDGKQEIIFNYGSSRFVRVFELNDSNKYRLAYTGNYPTPNSSHPNPMSIDIGDLNSDGLPDIISTDLVPGINLVWNKSKPNTFNRIDTVSKNSHISSINTSYYRTFYIDTVIDTIPNYIIKEFNYYRYVDSIKIDSILLDSTFYRYGSICTNYSDTLYHTGIKLDTITISSSTEIFYSTTDSIVFIGLNEREKETLKLFPNPIIDSKRLYIKNLNYMFEYRLYKISGEIVSSGTIDESGILLSETPGVYLLNIIKNDKVISIKKLIIQ
ncbi:MAG: hypothetical protein CMC96_09375 [Flavobacteriales bacterium]|nr:hypothetical protein [Flavobacteriales bacterium]|tara:strand:- start:32448 stop:34196 length:1749 start_codon:yes stop_codon:yes gene_type:complete